MRLTLTVTVDLTAEQARAYTREYNLTSGELPADVETLVAESLQHGTLGQFAKITATRTDPPTTGEQALRLAKNAGFTIVQDVIFTETNRHLRMLRHPDGRDLRIFTAPGADRFIVAQGTGASWLPNAREITSVRALQRALSD